MADKAQVSSVDAIESFRTRLAVYASKARGAVEEISAEVQRTRQWLEVDQRRLWMEQLQRRRKKLDAAMNELSSARLSSFQDTTAAQQMAVRRAREEVREAEAKLALLKKWERELESRAEPLLKQTNPLQHVLTQDMPRALAHLEMLVRTLEAYADVTGMPVRQPSTNQQTPAGDSPDASSSKEEPS